MKDIMKNYIIGIIFLIGALFMWSCDLDYEPLSATTDEEIQEMLASGDDELIDLILGSMANAMPTYFNASGLSGGRNCRRTLP